MCLHIMVLGCIQISSQATSRRDNIVRVGRDNQPLLVTPVYGKDASKCLAPDAVIISPSRTIIDTGLSGF